ncbi:MAG: VOC family protein [Nannocystaceae bacterium]|nr:VOC family protein [Nannocystaceae bacterium]
MAHEPPIITPRLVVAGADEAIAVYRRVFDAECIERFATPDGKVVHAALSIRGAVVAVTEEDPPINRGPKVLGGSPVLLHIAVDDPDAVAAAMVEEGGEIVIPVDDRFYGAREGRIVDPFGHLWIVSKKTETLTPEQIQRRMAASG